MCSKKIIVFFTVLMFLAATGIATALTDQEQLGKFIFFDQNLSYNYNQSCAVCHAPAVGWTGPDSMINEHGAVYEGSISGRFGNRKPPASAYAGRGASALGKCGHRMISETKRQEFDALIERYPVKRSALIPILHEVQAEVGHLAPRPWSGVAGDLGLSPADVMSVASFYDMLHLEPVGRHMIYVCQDLTCTLLGAEKLIRYLEGKLDIRMGETTSDGKITLKRMECLASCGTAPSIQVDGVYHHHVTPEKLDALLDELRRD